MRGAAWRRRCFGPRLRSRRGTVGALMFPAIRRVAKARVAVAAAVRAITRVDVHVSAQVAAAAKGSVAVAAAMAGLGLIDAFLRVARHAS